VLQKLTTTSRIPYAQLPGFPQPGVAGHAGELVLGKLGGTPVIVLNGRAHFYEGHAMEQVTVGIRTLAAIGVKAVLLLTNAAGGINRNFRAGDFMLLTDHINLMGANPLRGPAPKGPALRDLTQAYDAKLSGLLVKAAKATAK
jgi:purine-nucleoside phosphorylase